ncbi:MAG TPA: hypothetical protein VLD86_11345 [Ilumatobacteraceae bacterium]|nr:hypothetical protein [Ilumatobacteraceae bacterium]
MTPTPAELFTRHPANPILTADQWPVSVNTVFNPGACQVDGDTVLICRVEDTRGISHLWVARSGDGVGDWKIDQEALISPRPNVESEQWGLEDPRVVRVEELNSWAITCTAYGPTGPAVALFMTDFKTVQMRGLVMPPEDKNASLFPRRINGDWVLIHRPVTVHSGPKAEIWLSRSRDLDAWRRPERVLRTRPGAWWDSVRLGTGPPPIETPDGWLLIYHGVRNTSNGAIYRVGLALLDLDRPNRVLHRSPDWVLAPVASYERIGDVPNVVFPCGAIHDEATDEIRVYYGAADTSIGLATGKLSDILEYIHTCPPSNGQT